MIAYILLTTLLWPLLVIYTARSAWRYKSARHLKQRLGYGYPQMRSRPLWIHCASVGEINTLRPLLALLIRRYPSQTFLITTTTVTGAETLNKYGFTNCRHCYLPVDTKGAVKRFLRHMRPRLALIMETELWPLLYRQCHRQHIPISIINGRLSARTLNSSNWVKARYRQALGQVDHVLCRTAADMQGFVQLGMAEQDCEILGNLKFAQPLSSASNTVAELTGRPYVLAASTHDNEEWQLSKIWADMSRHPQLLVIAPRHPQRAQAILDQLNPLHIKVAQRSRGDKVTDATDVYLADTLGELGALIAGAELVFIGGSLIPRGGQNLLEPAAHGKPIIVGPHMENFAAETALLLSRQACIQVDSSDQLASTLVELLADPEQQRRLGDQARKVMEEQAQVAETYLHCIDRYYGPLLDDEAAS